jgi:hypothetical protein
MGQLLAVLVVAGSVAAVLGSLAWLGSRLRRRGVGGAIMGPFDEIWHPAAHRFRHEIQTHEERVVPMPSPDDQLSPVLYRNENGEPKGRLG